MKKKTLLMLPMFLLTAMVLPFAANLVEAKASEQADELIAPQTYEEYLPLTAPTDVAVSENYTAIADENCVYVYDRSDETYRKYEHTLNAIDSSKNRVTKLQFDENDNLFFLDASTNLYYLKSSDLTAPETAVAVDTQFTCSTFILCGDQLYYTNVTTQTQLSKVPLSDLDKNNGSTLIDELSSKPTLTFWDGELYYTDSGKHLYKMNPEASEPKESFVAAFPSELVSMTVKDGSFACSDIDGGFAVYDLAELSIAKDASGVEASCKKTGSFSSLCSFGEFIYATNGGSVQRYTVENKAFDAFEICSSSASPMRLSGATEALLAGSTLFIADNGNSRISVYDTEEKVFKNVIKTPLPPLFLAADETSVLAADTASVTLHSLAKENYGKQLCAFDSFTGNVIGVANVYGTYYIATDTAQNYALTMDGEWKLSQPVQMHLSNPKAITADVYGNLYVLTSSNIYKYAESDFVNPSIEGQKLNLNLPTATTKIAVDYNGAVYALANNAIYRADGTVFNFDEAIYRADGTVFNFDEQLVYYENADTEPTIHSFAIGVEENETYLLCEGNYLIKSSALSLPTVKTIGVNGADENIFENANAEFTIVKTAENTLLVEFDLQTLGGAEHFPYLSLERASAQKTALKIGETDKYYLLAEYDKDAGAYRTYLALNSSCTPLEANDYCTEYPLEEQKTGYITSAITLYKFPYLTELLKSGELKRGACVTVLGEINELDHAYFHVALENENGEIKTGYIPQAFVTDFSGVPPTSETIEVGETKNDDSVWRLAYLLLGFAVICILTDCLLLRKKKGGDDYE